MSTEQFLLRLDSELIERLKDLARRHNRDSGNKLAAEIISLYLPHWEKIEELRQSTIARQAGQVMSLPQTDAARRLEALFFGLPDNLSEEKQRELETLLNFVSKSLTDIKENSS
jgi:predicted transcriptional regulator